MFLFLLTKAPFLIVLQPLNLPRKIPVLNLHEHSPSFLQCFNIHTPEPPGSTRVLGPERSSKPMMIKNDANSTSRIRR